MSRSQRGSNGDRYVSLDTEQFQTAVNRLIDRHGALRTYILPSRAEH